MRSRRRKSADGFSLLEVLVAVVILSISIVVLAESQARSLQLIGRARSLDTATALAEVKMTEVTRELTEKGFSELKDEEAGDFDQEAHPGYRWRYWIKEVPMPDFAKMIEAMAPAGEDGEEQASNAALLAGPLQQISKVWEQALREVHVEVLWGNEKNLRRYELVTHLIAQDAVVQLQAVIGALSGGASLGESGDKK